MKPLVDTTARAALLRAIQIEARNAGIYDSLAQLFQGYDDSVLAIFCEMADEERQHGAQLQQSYSQRFGVTPILSEEVEEVIEAPDLQDPETMIFDAMSVERALQTGLRAEQEAREFYRRELIRTSDPGLQAIFRELAEFEEEHVRILQDKLALKRASKGSGSEVS